MRPLAHLILRAAAYVAAPLVGVAHLRGWC